MTNYIRFMTGMASALALGACAARHDSAHSATPADVAAAPTPVVSGVVGQNTITVNATVEKVDLNTRHVTLRGPDGNLVTVQAGDQVRNLAQVKKGDVVTVTYYESLAYEVKKPGQAVPGVAVAKDVARAEPGAKPGAAGAQAVTVTSTIAAIDMKNNTVTLRAPDGELTTIHAKDPSKLAKVNVGDLVEVTYTEALAIGVEPAAKK